MPDYGADFFTDDQDRQNARTMTHDAPQRGVADDYLDKVKGWINTAQRFASGGLQGAGALSDAPDWVQHNPVQSALQNPDNQAALQLFGGPSAKTADLSALTQAKRMAEGGSSARDILRRTGWFQGTDRGWRYEIPDVGSKFLKTPAYGKASTDTMQDVLHHPELYAAYPELADMQAYRMSKKADWTGVYNPPQGKEAQRLGINTTRYPNEDPRTVMLHELQHSIQEKEGWDPGGWPANVSREMQKNYSPDDIYFMGAGETEARNVETRKDMTPAQLKKRAPWNTQDVDSLLQILSRP